MFVFRLIFVSTNKMADTEIEQKNETDLSKSISIKFEYVFVEAVWLKLLQKLIAMATW